MAAFNLINQVDVEETDKRILAYQRENAEQIDLQSSNEERQSEMVRLQDEDDRRQRAQRAADFAKQDEVDRAERKQDESELIKLLQESDVPALLVLQKQKAVALKRSSARMASDSVPPNTANSKPSLLSKYMQYNRSNFPEREIKDPFEPEDPMADYDENWYDYRDLFELGIKGKEYMDSGIQDALSDTKKLAGGFDVVKSVLERALRSAVMGLWTLPLEPDMDVDMDMHE